MISRGVQNVVAKVWTQSVRNNTLQQEMQRLEVRTAQIVESAPSDCLDV
jgi:hypothetical protein